MNTLFLTALGLSMDACAASIALSATYRSFIKLFLAAISFALFQALMPTLGYFLGLPFKGWIASVDHWIAFLVLGALGLSMVLNFKKEEEPKKKIEPLRFRTIFALAFGTSLDAFIVGIGFHALSWNLLSSVITIGWVTFVMSLLGLGIGVYSKDKFSSYTEKLGGYILIFLGFKILITHLIE